MRIVALLPTFHRPEGLKRAIRSLRETASNVDIVVAADPDDTEGIHTAVQAGVFLAICGKPKLGCANAWNTALRAALDYDLYIIASDDAIFEPGWYQAAWKGLAELGGSGIVGFHSPDSPVALALHYMMTRDFIIEHHGGVAAIPHYTAWCVDTEAQRRAEIAGKFYKAMDAIVTHDWKGPDGDEGYIIGRDRKEDNKALFYERKKKGFPDDFKPILRKEKNAGLVQAQQSR
jgi:GT2 family glycosyltransferase